jgi:hypothetical protein
MTAQSESQSSNQSYTPGFKIQAKPPVPKFQGILIERFRKALKNRGARGIMGLQR